MGQPKRHHTVPQFILSNFTNNSDALLWCYNRDRRKCFKTSPKNVFVERHLYSAVREDGTRNAHAERHLAERIEPSAAPVIAKIIDRARSRSSLDITPEEKRALLVFWRMQNARTKHSFDFFQDKVSLDEVLRMSEDQGYRFSEEEREQLTSKAVRDRIKQNAWVGQLTDGHNHHSESMRILMSRGVGVRVIEKSRKSFVIGDYPVIRTGTKPGPGDLGSPGVLELFPVAYDVIIYWGRMKGDPERVVISETDKIRTLNEASLRQSRTIAGRSYKLVRSLSRSSAALGEPKVWAPSSSRMAVRAPPSCTRSRSCTAAICHAHMPWGGVGEIRTPDLTIMSRTL